MELKDVILSTLAEMEEGGNETAAKSAVSERFRPAETVEAPSVKQMSGMNTAEIIEDECRYLESVKERLLVLFEGFQSPNNTHIEAKVDLTLNFLEYLLSSIDGRIETMKKSGR